MQRCFLFAQTGNSSRTVHYCHDSSPSWRSGLKRYKRSRTLRLCSVGGKDGDLEEREAGSEGSNGNSENPGLTRAAKPLAVRPHPKEGPKIIVARPMPRVLVLHTGGTLGMDAGESFDLDPQGHLKLREGTGGLYPGQRVLKPGHMLENLMSVVPELRTFAHLELQVVFNRDSSNVGPKEWVKLAKVLHTNRERFDAFLVVHGTDTMSFTASALSLMLAGFRKPIVVTGSQLPLAQPRSDARQNLIDSLTCATASFTPPHVQLQEVAICFGGKLMRANRAQKRNSSVYQAFASPSYPNLASLGVGIEWNSKYLLQVEGVYRPRFNLDPRVMRIPIIPGSDPRQAYGDLFGRGVRGVVLEAFGVGNMPDLKESGWLPWLKGQTKKGLQVYLGSQCDVGPLHPELYRSGKVALSLGVEAGPQMTPECAAVKMMLCLRYPDLPLGCRWRGSSEAEGGDPEGGGGGDMRLTQVGFGVCGRVRGMCV